MKINKIIPFLLIAVYFLVSIIKLRYPGIFYDEILFGNAALGATADNTFVVFRIKGIPVLLMQYIGVLKALVYMPIFKLFGVSVFTIRLPMILLTCLSLFLLYRLLLRFLQYKVAILTLLLLVLDSSFITYIRMDSGPVAIGFFFRVLSLSLFIKFLSCRNVKLLFGIGLCFLLGWYHKMDFIWFIIAFTLSSLIDYRRELMRFAQKKIHTFTRNLIFLFSFIFMLLFGYIAYIYKFYDSIKLFNLTHVKLVMLHYASFIQGTLFGQTLFGYTDPIQNRFYLFTFLVLIVLGAYVGGLLKKKKEIQLISLILILTIIQIFITDKSGAGWHLFMTIPFYHILVSYAIAQFILSKQRIVKVFGLTLIAIFLSYQIITYSVYVRGYDKPLAAKSWSASIYDLIGYTKKHNNRFVSVDWGTHTQLLTFDYRKGKYMDMWPSFSDAYKDKLSRDRIIKELYTGSNTVFITHGVKTSTFPETRKNFFRLAEELKLQPFKIKEFSDGQAVIYELYSLKKK